MKSLWLKLLGVSRRLWDFIWPLLKGKVGEFLADERVQQIAKDAVLEAAKLYTSGNAEKSAAAIDAAKRDLAVIGKEYVEAWVATAVESAFQALKAKGEVR